MPIPDGSRRALVARWVAKPENRMKFVKAAEQFLAKHLGGRFET